MPVSRTGPSSPLLFPAAGLAAGIAAGHYFIAFPYTVSLASLLALAALVLLKKIPPSSRVAGAAFYLAGLFAFFAWGPGAESPVSGLVGKGPVALTGEVVRPPQEKNGYTVAFLRPDGARAFALFRRGGLVRLRVRGERLGIKYGDVLSGTMELEAPAGFRNQGTFDWGAYVRLNGEDAVAYAPPDKIYRLGNRAWPPLARLYSLRQALTRKAKSSMRTEASTLFNAMVLGDQGGVTDSMRDGFSASGTTHILSVSGSHVALLAALIYFMVKWSFSLLPHGAALRLSLHADQKKLAAAVAIPVSIFYCALTGAEVATVRSVVMITVFLAAVLLDRESDLLNTLSISALAVLVLDPSALFDISFQLSYGSVLCVAVSLRAAGGHAPEDPSRRPYRNIRRWLFITLLTSAAVIAGTGPLAARHFNSFSWVGLPANLLVIPFAGFLIVPLGLTSCLLYSIAPGGALPLAGLSAFVIDIFYGMVKFFASAPYANLHPPAPPLWLLVLFFASVAAVAASRAPRARKGAAAAACVIAFSALNYASFPGKEMRVVFLDVGRGDCALVRFPSGENMLIDGGGSIRGIDPGRAAVAPYLWNHGVRKVDYLVLSHPHPDHMDGLFYILRNFEVGQVWEGGLVKDSRDYRYFRALAGRRKIPRYVLSSNGGLTIGGAAVQVLHTSASPVEDDGGEPYARENNRSLVLRIKYGDVSFLLCGDAGREAQEAMLQADPPLPLKSTVIKAPHHGGPSSLDEGFARAVGPAAAIISGRSSAGQGPSPATVSLLESAGARVYTTGRDGGLTVTTDGRTFDVKTYYDGRPGPAKGLRDEMENWRRVI